MPRSVLFFLSLGGLFALTHAFATLTALYWYYSWFDIIMHFWGGLLIVLGVHALARMDFPIRTNKRTIFSIAMVLMVGWEVFEYVIGLSSIAGQLNDIIKDIFVGSAGVIIGYTVFKTTKR
jgi:hypothetical protein